MKEETALMTIVQNPDNVKEIYYPKLYIISRVWGDSELEQTSGVNEFPQFPFFKINGEIALPEKETF